jgi:hypothetical protein
MDNFYLKIFAIILILIIICIVYIILNNINIFSEKIPDIIKKNIEIPPEVTSPINNEIKILTEKDKLRHALELFNYKHTTFIKNLDNSIEFCIDNDKFILANTITDYKKLYLELYKMKLDNEGTDLNKNEDFLLKCIQLDNLNNSILNQK